MIEDILKKNIEDITNEEIKTLEESIVPLSETVPGIFIGDHFNCEKSLKILKNKYKLLTGDYTNSLTTEKLNSQYLYNIKILSDQTYEVSYENINKCFFNNIIPVFTPIFPDIYGDTVSVKSIKIKINIDNDFGEIIDNIASLQFLFTLTSEINKYKYFYKAIITPEVEILDKSILNADKSFDVNYLKNSNYIKIHKNKFIVMLRVA